MKNLFLKSIAIIALLIVSQVSLFAAQTTANTDDSSLGTAGVVVGFLALVAFLVAPAVKTPRRAN